jgi:predicted metal-dependent peptidase
MNTEERVRKARAALVLDHPFFGALALRQTVIIDDSIKTAATDGKHLIFAPSFVDTLTDPELLFLVAHEVFHSVFDHPYRRHGRNHRRWNIAGDYVINQHLIDEKIGRMPKKGLYDRALFAAGGGSTDGIYAILDQQSGGGDQPGPGEPGGSLDDCRDGGQTPAEIATAEAENKVAIAQAAQAAKMMGKLSAGLDRLVGQLLKPKVPWAEVARDFAVRAKREERTYARPARRFVPLGIYAPSRDGQRMPRMVVAVDCSGSIRTELDQFAAEMRAIHEDLQPEVLDIIYFDAVVTRTESFEPGDHFEINPKGGGGTRFSPFFKHINEQDTQPACCIVLTDLCVNDFGPAPDYPVLFCTTDKTEAPFGQVLSIK